MTTKPDSAQLAKTSGTARDSVFSVNVRHRERRYHSRCDIPSTNASPSPTAFCIHSFIHSSLCRNLSTIKFQPYFLNHPKSKTSAPVQLHPTLSLSPVAVETSSTRLSARLSLSSIENITGSFYLLRRCFVCLDTQKAHTSSPSSA